LPPNSTCKAWSGVLRRICVVSVMAARQRGWYGAIRQIRRNPRPSVIGPERFHPAITGITPSVRAARIATPLSRSSSPSRSFCLRVSGAVAPSAFAFGSGRQVGLGRRRTSPARDLLSRRLDAPHGGFMRWRHHRGEPRGVNADEDAARFAATSAAALRSPEAPKSVPKCPR